MAAKKKAEEETAETVAEVVETAEPAPVKAETGGKKIPLEKLKRSSLKLFGVDPSTFDGATMGLEGKYTVDEMKAIIDNWLKKEVK